MKPALVVLVAAGSADLADLVVDTAGGVVGQAVGVDGDSVVVAEVAGRVGPAGPADLVQEQSKIKIL